MENLQSSSDSLLVRVHKFIKPSWVLILSNCVPLLGYLFLGWDVFQTVFLYWLENAVVALSTALLLFLKPISPADREGVPFNAKLLLIPFFFVHFGGFMIAHLFLIIFFLGSIDQGNIFYQAIQVFRTTPAIGWSLLSLLISYGYTFVTTEILAKKYLQPLTKENLPEIMIKPYRRVIIMQLTVLVSAAAIIILGLPQPMVVALIVVKTYFDLKSQKREVVRGGMLVSHES